MVSIDRSISERKIVDIVSKLKVGERLLEETSRAESDLQIARAQEGECREVSVRSRLASAERYPSTMGQGAPWFSCF